ncbi:DUF6497 family protein [Ketogulonicigenium robustum]|nr:DUF6497 family protein [Ketogulonicigenium robustum]
MRVYGLAIALLLAAGPLAAQDVTAPSGRAAQLYDVRIDADIARFRLTMPALAGADAPPSDLTDDAQWLCSTLALPALAANGAAAGQIVISLSATPVDFGDTTSDVPQFFEGFDVIDGACEWGLF